jgi:hypothetical protein
MPCWAGHPRCVAGRSGRVIAFVPCCWPAAACCQRRPDSHQAAGVAAGGVFCKGVDSPAPPCAEGACCNGAASILSVCMGQARAPWGWVPRLIMSKPPPFVPGCPAHHRAQSSRLAFRLDASMCPLGLAHLGGSCKISGYLFGLSASAAADPAFRGGWGGAATGIFAFGSPRGSGAARPDVRGAVGGEEGGARGWLRHWPVMCMCTGPAGSPCSGR